MKQILTDRRFNISRQKNKEDSKQSNSGNQNKQSMQNNSINSNNSEENDPIKTELSVFEHSRYYIEENPFYLEESPKFDMIDYDLSYPQWAEQYYDHFFEISKKNMKKYNSVRRNASRDYLTSLLFTLKYYIQGVPPDWRWAYQYRVAPLASDINYYLSKCRNINSLSKCFDNQSKPFTPYQQLMMVIPPTKTHDVLPKAYANLTTSSKSSIIKYYPVDFELDVLAGEKYIYSEPLLPELEYKDILKAIEPLEKKLAKANKNRDSLNDIVYIH